MIKRHLIPTANYHIELFWAIIGTGNTHTDTHRRAHCLLWNNTSKLNKKIINPEPILLYSLKIIKFTSRYSSAVLTALKIVNRCCRRSRQSDHAPSTWTGRKLAAVHELDFVPSRQQSPVLNKLRHYAANLRRLSLQTPIRV